MLAHRKELFWMALRAYCIPSLLIGLISLSLLFDHGGVLLRRLETLVPAPLVQLFSALLNGCIVAAGVVLVKYRLPFSHPLFTVVDPRLRREMLIAAACVGFLCGAFNVYLMLYPIGMLAIVALVTIILRDHLRRFANLTKRLLTPGTVPTWPEVAQLANIYLTFLAAFTILNACLEYAYILLKAPKLPFNFSTQQGLLLDALYFSTQVVTTLGFGDITPQTLDAKILVMIECLTGYGIFALTVGIITRGVISRERKH